MTATGILRHIAHNPNQLTARVLLTPTYPVSTLFRPPRASNYTTCMRTGPIRAPTYTCPRLTRTISITDVAHCPAIERFSQLDIVQLRIIFFDCGLDRATTDYIG